MIYGVNIHQYPWASTTETNYVWNVAPKVVDAAATLGFEKLRVFAVQDPVDASAPTSVARINTLNGLATSRGMALQIVFESPFKFSRTAGGVYADSQAGRVALGDGQMTQFLEGLNFTPTEIELENEVTLTCGLAHNTGLTLAEYNVTALNEWADVIRGEYDAVQDVAPSAKVIVGIVYNHAPFVQHLMNRGVSPDMIGMHVYPSDSERSLHSFNGAGSWYDRVAPYGKPVTVNEINGQNGISASASQATNTLALIAEMQAQSKVRIESAYVFELFDSVGEPNFGLCTHGGTFARKTHGQILLNGLR